MTIINNKLSNLNLRYSEITDLVPNIYYFTDDYARVINDSLISESDDDVTAIAVQSDNKYLIGFQGSSFGVKRYNSNGSVDTSFGVTFENFSRISKILVQSNNKIILLGSFEINTGFNIVRLNSNGSVDSSFNVGMGFDSEVYDGYLNSDESQLIVRGGFGNYNGNNDAILVTSIETIDGSITANFNTNMNPETTSGVSALTLDSDDIYLESAGTVLKFNLSGEPALYNASTSGGAATFLLPQSGKILRASDNGYLERINSDGTLDNTFSSVLFGQADANPVNYMTLDGSGNILVGGTFGGINGVSRHKLCKLNSNGGLLGFNSPFDFEEVVLSIAITGTSVLVGGRFNKPGRKIVKLNSSGEIVSGYSLTTDLLYIGIEDGGDDIEDGGNYMDTNLTQLYSNLDSGIRNYDLSIPNSHTPANNDRSDDPEDQYGYAYKPTTIDGSVVDGTNYFGSGSNYFTNMYPGMYVMVATNVSISEFSVTGNSGTDGGGQVSVYSFELTKDGTKYSCFLRSVHGDDPSNNGLIIVKGGLSNFTYQYNDSSERDDNSIGGLSGVTDIVYYMMICRGSESGGEGSVGDPFTNEMAEQVASKFLDIVEVCNTVTLELNLSPENPELIHNYYYDGEGNMDTAIVVDPITGKRRSLQRTGYFELTDNCGNRKVVSARDGETFTNSTNWEDAISSSIVGPTPTPEPTLSPTPTPTPE